MGFIVKIMNFWKNIMVAINSKLEECTMQAQIAHKLNFAYFFCSKKGIENITMPMEIPCRMMLVPNPIYAKTKNQYMYLDSFL